MNESQKTGLIADIGGTNIRLAIATRAGYNHVLELKCADYKGPAEAVQAYLQKIDMDVKPSVGVFDVAGPISGDHFKMTNNEWSFSVSDVQKKLGFDSLHLLNDFEAVALGIPMMTDKDLVKIGGGDIQKEAPIAVIGPGTGLGAASVITKDGLHIAVPGEGGHMTMPAKTRREFDIFQAMKENKYSHVSAERVCSGKGLVNLYKTICLLDRKSKAFDLTPKEISAKGMSGECDICAECLDLMCGFLGTIAGNMSLALGAHGGVYIAGGIPVKLGEYFLNSRFRSEFEDKGRFRDYMESIPTFLVTHPYIALHGLQHDLVQRNLI